MRKHLLALLAIPLALVSAQVQAEDVDYSSKVSDIATDGWTCTGSDTWHVNTGWSDGVGSSDGSGMTGPFMEYWTWSNSGTANLSDATLTKTISELPAGSYEFTALVRAMREDGSVTISGATIIANEGSADCCEGSTCTYNDHNGTYGTYSVTGVVGSDGTLTVGFKLASVNFNWFCFKDMTLTYKGVVLDDMKAVLKTLITQCAGYDGVKMAADVSTALTSAKERGQTAYDATYESDDAAQEAYSSAIGALHTAISNADASIEVYATAADVLPQMKALTESTNVYTADAYEEYYGQWQTKYDEGTLTADEASSLEDPYAVNDTYQRAVTVDEFLMSCFDVTSDGDWSSYYINTWSSEGSSDGSGMTTPFFEYWTNVANTLAEKTITATIPGLSAGKYYSVSALVRVQVQNNGTDGTGITLQVGDGTAVDVCNGIASSTAGYYYDTYKAIGTADSEGNLIVKFNVASDNNIAWLSFKDVNYAEVGDPKVGDATITPTAGYVDVDDLNTVTFAYKDAESALGTFQILNESGVTCGDQTATLSLSGTVLTATFADLAAVRGQGYTVQIAAGTVGYSDGTTTYASNDAASADYTVAPIAEGTYFIQRSGTETFLTAGGYYGTEAVVGEYGIPFTLEMTSEGTYYLRNTVSNAAASNTKGITGTSPSFWTDQAGTAYTIEAGTTDGTYYIKADGSYFTSTLLESYNYNYLSVTSDQTAAYEWKLISRSDYDGIIASRDAAQIAAVAEAAGVDDVEAIAALMTAEDKTASITNPSYAASDGWTAVKLNDKGSTGTFSTGNNCWEVWGVEARVSQTISGLEEGLYKVTVNAFQRPGSKYNGIYAAEVFVPTSYMFANTESATNQKLLVNWSSVSDYVDNLSEVKSTVAADASKYLNEMYVYVKDGETLTLGVNADGEIGGAGLWVAATNWTLTKYASPTVTITEAGKLEEDGTTYYYATYSTPTAVDLSKCDFTAYTVTASGTTLTYTEQTGIVPAGTGLVIRGTEAKTYDVAVTASEATAIEDNDLQVADGQTTGDGETIYILANGTNGLGWYICTANTVINEGKCYLTISGASGAKFIGLGDVADGIGGVATEQAKSGVRYNLSGQRVGEGYKGIVIENGKKYLLK